MSLFKECLFKKPGLYVQLIRRNEIIDYNYFPKGRSNLLLLLLKFQKTYGLHLNFTGS